MVVNILTSELKLKGEAAEATLEEKIIEGINIKDIDSVRIIN